MAGVTLIVDDGQKKITKTATLDSGDLSAILKWHVDERNAPITSFRVRALPGSPPPVPPKPVTLENIVETMLSQLIASLVERHAEAKRSEALAKVELPKPATFKIG